MNLFRNSLGAVALVALAVLLLAPVAEASRSGLPAAQAPTLEPPAPDLEAGTDEPEARHLGLFREQDFWWPPRPLELVEARKPASGSREFSLSRNPLQYRVFNPELHRWRQMGTVIAVLEDIEPPAGGDGVPPLKARVLYDPYGQAHVEEGPELRSVEHDPGMTSLDGVEQDDLTLGPVENPVIGIAGGVVVTTSMALDEATLDAGLILERCDPGCVALGPAEVVIARDEVDATKLNVMPVAGWLEGKSYRVNLSTDLADAYERSFTVPGGGSEYVVSIAIPTGVEATGDPLPSLPLEIPLIFDTVAAASATLGCDGEPCFPGGINLLFQGLWHDPVTGIAYARNRWYDARTASWLSEDPKGAVDSPNLYAFVGWGPHHGRDPMGLATDYNLPPASPMKPRPQLPKDSVNSHPSWIVDALMGLEGLSARDAYENTARFYFGDPDGVPWSMPPAGQGTPRGVFVNGIKNWESRARQSARDASDLLGIALIPVWNPTVERQDSSGCGRAFATCFDIAQVTFVDKQNVPHSTTRAVLAEVRAQLAKHGTTSLVGHSQGGAIVSSVAQQLTPDERARVDVVTIGGAAWGMPKGMRSVTMHVNTRDIVPMLTGGGMIPLRKLLDDNENTKVVYYSFGKMRDLDSTHSVDAYLQASRSVPASTNVIEAELLRDILEGKTSLWTIGLLLP